MAMQHKPRKTYQQEGRWVERPGKTMVLVCACGAKYIKTRDRQNACLRCTHHPQK